jgi:hypothetical protein
MTVDVVLHVAFVLVFWALFFTVLGLTVLGTFAMYRTVMTWLTGEEWTP